MSYAAEPLKVARAGALTLSWCFSVIAASVGEWSSCARSKIEETLTITLLGLNALIKSNQQKSKIRKLAASPTVVYIDTTGEYLYLPLRK